MKRNKDSVSILLQVCEEKDIGHFTFSGDTIEILDYLTTAVAMVIQRANINKYDIPRIYEISQNLAMIIATKVMGDTNGFSDSGKTS